MATPDPVRRHGFQFDGTFTTADGIPFEHPVTLRRLCFPSDPEQWKAPNQGRGRPRKVPEFSDADSARILTRKFVAAQSRFYGVPQAQQGAGAERAVQVFRQQVGDGLFERMSKEVEKLKEAMIAEWKAKGGIVKGPLSGRPRGRPKGSTKQSTGKVAPKSVAAQVAAKVAAKPRGRPPGSTKSSATAATKSREALRDEPSSSIVGSYVITCKEIDEQWPNSGTLTLDITEEAPGLYYASFDFRVLEGVMILSADKQLLDGHIRTLEAEENPSADEDDDEDDDEEDDEDEDEDEDDGGDAGRVGAGSKRKAAKGTSTKVSKKAKTSSTPTKFFLQWRGRETGEGTIETGVHEGTIQFADKKYIKISGDMDMGFVGGEKFEGKKVSAEPHFSGESWSNFSESAYEYARVNRWR